MWCGKKIVLSAKNLSRAPSPLSKQYLIRRDVRHITEGGVIQAQELQGPLQLLERIDAALARLNAEREKERSFRSSLLVQKKHAL